MEEIDVVRAGEELITLTRKLNEIVRWINKEKDKQDKIVRWLKEERVKINEIIEIVEESGMWNDSVG